MSAPTPAQPDTLRSIFYALGANLAITVTKFCGAAYTGSGSLLAESFHSLADSGNQVLLLLGRKQATAPPTVRHPLGHGRATYFWSFIVTLLLFSLGGVLSIYEGYLKLREQTGIESPWVAVAIVLVAMLLEGLSLRVTLRQIAGVRQGMTLYRWFRETRRGELIVVLGEDIAAIAGLTLALAALAATILTGNPTYDALGSIGIGGLLIVVASGLAIEIKSLLIGESASPRMRRVIRQFFERHPNVVEIRSLLTMQQQGEEILVAVQVRMQPSLTGERLLRAIAQCKVELQSRVPQTKWIFIEPVADSDDRHRKAGAQPPSRTRRSRRRRSIYA